MGSLSSLTSIINQYGLAAVLGGGGGDGGTTINWATAGVISDYTDPGPGTVYRAHIFTSSGTFIVTDAQLTCIDYLVVGGGGGGGSNSPYAGGGGGAGLLKY